jgi:hypothetical protein
MECWCFYATAMMQIDHSVLVATTCTKTSTAAGIISGIFFLAVVGAIVALAVANSRARTQLAAARAELNFLRPERVRMQKMLGIAGTGVADASGYESGSTAPAQWYPDPRGVHELRYWDGSAWTSHVSNQGMVSKDESA